ncbi:MAG: fibronectin type III domain-containing protein [Bryobacteraceae bacterium]
MGWIKPQAAGGADTTPPTIFNLDESGFTPSSVKISWNTNEPASTQIEYGTTLSYGSTTTLDTGMVTYHNQTISGAGLQPGIVYYYRVRSRDQAQNLGTQTGDFVLPPVAPTQLTGPSRVEVNLGPLPINLYSDSQMNLLNGQPVVPPCPTTKTVRQCYKDAFVPYRVDQNVTGVRFQFGICGGGNSKALNNCDQTGPTNPPPIAENPNWDANLSLLYQDLKDAGINNVTLTPALHGFGGDEGAWYRTPSGGFFTITDPCRPNSPLTEVEHWPASPYLLVPAGNTGAFTQGPHLGFFSQSYNCSPRNNRYSDNPRGTFIGYPWLYNVFSRAVNLARQKGLTVVEFDLQNEVAIDIFTVQARLIYDNKYDEDVIGHVRAIMAPDQLRVTTSSLTGGALKPWIETELQAAGFDCPSIYGDSARIYGSSELLAAFGGGLIGLPANAVESDGADSIFYTRGLMCTDSTLSRNSNVSHMVSVPRQYEPPNIIDIHHTGVLGQTNEAGGAIAPAATQSIAASRAEAAATFNAVGSLIASFCPGGWRGSVPNVCNALFMLGETSAWKPNASTSLNCDGSPANTPFGTAQGFNQSTLAGRPAGSVYRFWLDGVNGPLCYELPHPVSQVVLPTP